VLCNGVGVRSLSDGREKGELTLSIFFEIVPFPPPGGPMMRVVISDLRATLCSAATVSDFALHVSGVVAGSRGRTIVEWNQWGLIQHCDKRI